VAVLQAGNSIYQVYVSNSGNVGQYTATTGPGNPAGNGLNILYGGGSPGTSFSSIHSYTTGTDYTQARSVNGSVDLSPYGSVSAIGTTGFQTTYTLPGPPTTPDKMTIVQVFNVSGTTFNDSHIDLTTTVTNTGTTPISIGVRHELDWQIGSDDGPTFQAQNPNGSVLHFESDFLNPTFQYFRIEDNDVNPHPPTFDVLATVAGPSNLVPTPTPPTRTVYAYWPNAVGSSFAYTANPACQVADQSGSGGGCHNDSAELQYWGDTAGDAISLAPGASSTVSMSLFGGPPGTTPGDQQVTSNGTNISATEGKSFSGTVATVTDPDTNATPGEYSASINWGDGQTSTGTVTGSGGSFTVSGSHTYAEEGSHNVTVTTTDVDNSGNAATATSHVAIADAALSASGVSKSSPAQFTGTVATFHDQDPAGTISDYSVTINWGDGHVTGGTVSSGFLAKGNHTYGHSGVFHVTVTIKDGGGSTVSTSATINVSSTAAPQLKITKVSASAPQVGCKTELAFVSAVLGMSCNQGQVTVSGTVNRAARGKVHVKISVNLPSGPASASGSGQIHNGHWKLTLRIAGIDRDPRGVTYTVLAAFNGSSGVRSGHASKRAGLEVESVNTGPL
jgi:hypothetical protein